VDRFICVSQTTEKSLLGFLSGSLAESSGSTSRGYSSFISNEKNLRTEVIPNGLTPLANDSESFVFNAQAIQPNLSIGYIGRLSEEKRPYLLIETLRCLPAEAHLSIAGDGVMRSKLQEVGKDLMANGQLNFLGRQASSRNLYAPYQATLLTSQYEGCSMSALESLACSVPCVALPIPSMRELFENDAPYLLAHDETPQALAIAILNLMRIPVEQVKTDIAQIVNKHAFSNFTNSWRLALQDLLVPRKNA
jgi:glycosyltransferase involved in cell wall biosynthesis